MRHESHGTWIGTIRGHVTEWRKSNGWSRETVCDAIVKAHDLMNAQQSTGIRFECRTTDAFERTKNNADRIFRWLDDDTKDNNLLPANFIPSILSAMPDDRRMNCLDDLLRPLDMSARRLNVDTESGSDLKEELVKVIQEDSQAHIAVAGLIGGDVCELKLNHALTEVSEAIETKKVLRSRIERKLAKVRKRQRVES